uniref:Uncharacterized protein n=1 Tax=Glypta fumiferanae TaxID=389681 RepID=A0A0F6QA61_9HYME|nr:hypothetical protein [Glypta fumiferanae]
MNCSLHKSSNSQSIINSHFNFYSNERPGKLLIRITNDLVDIPDNPRTDKTMSVTVAYTAPCIYVHQSCTDKLQCGVRLSNIENGTCFAMRSALILNVFKHCVQCKIPLAKQRVIILYDVFGHLLINPKIQGFR